MVTLTLTESELELAQAALYDYAQEMRSLASADLDAARDMLGAERAEELAGEASRLNDLADRAEDLHERLAVAR